MEVTVRQRCDDREVPTNPPPLWPRRGEPGALCAGQCPRVRTVTHYTGVHRYWNRTTTSSEWRLRNARPHHSPHSGVVVGVSFSGRFTRMRYVRYLTAHCAGFLTDTRTADLCLGDIVDYSLAPPPHSLGLSSFLANTHLSVYVFSSPVLCYGIHPRASNLPS